MGRLPVQLDRADFPAPTPTWLVVVFTSATCHTCADVAAKAAVLASDEVAVDGRRVPRRRAVHDRYGIDAVPSLVIADHDGVVRTQLPRAGDRDRPVGGAVAAARTRSVVDGSAPSSTVTRPEGRRRGPARS